MTRYLPLVKPYEAISGTSLATTLMNLACAYAKLDHAGALTGLAPPKTAGEFALKPYPLKLAPAYLSGHCTVGANKAQSLQPYQVAWGASPSDVIVTLALRYIELDVAGLLPAPG